MRVTSGNNAKGQPTRGNSVDEGNNIKSFSRREFPRFKSREQALTWLVKD
jgi:hypothetical protein